MGRLSAHLGATVGARDVQAASCYAGGGAGGGEADGEYEVLATWRPKGWPAGVAPLKYCRTRRIPLEKMATEGVAFLETFGFCVVAGVLSDAVCGDVTARLWTTIEGLGTHILRGDPSTWTSERWFPGDVGLCGDNGANDGLIHSEPAWRVRANPRVKAVFAALHGTQGPHTPHRTPSPSPSLRARHNGQLRAAQLMPTVLPLPQSC